MFSVFKPKLKNVKKIDIGCGREKEQGYFGLDVAKVPGVDYGMDFDKGRLPFKDNSIEHIVTYHALEHFKNPRHVVDEMWRVAKPNSQIFVCVPYFSNHLNLANPFHLHQFNEHSFRFFSNEEETDCMPKSMWSYHFARSWGLKNSANANEKTELRCLKIEIDYFPEYKNLPHHEQEAARLKYFNVAHNICFYLQVIKGPAIEIQDKDIVVPPKRKWMIANNW